MPARTFLRADEFLATIYVDRAKLLCYNPETTRDGKVLQASCYIVSEADKAFTVEFDRGDFDRWKLAVVLFLDGVKVDSRLLCPEDGHTTTRFEEIVNEDRIQFFKFLEITEDMDVGDRETYNINSPFGTIHLEVYRVVNVRKAKVDSTEDEHVPDEAEPLILAKPPAGILGSSYHRVVLENKEEESETIERSSEEYARSDAGSENSTESDLFEFEQRQCLATLTFFYRPSAVLERAGIIPRRNGGRKARMESSTAPVLGNRQHRPEGSTASLSSTRLSSNNDTRSEPQPAKKAVGYTGTISSPNYARKNRVYGTSPPPAQSQIIDSSQEYATAPSSPTLVSCIIPQPTQDVLRERGLISRMAADMHAATPRTQDLPRNPLLKVAQKAAARADITQQSKFSLDNALRPRKESVAPEIAPAEPSTRTHGVTEPSPSITREQCPAYGYNDWGHSSSEPLRAPESPPVQYTPVSPSYTPLQYSPQWIRDPSPQRMPHFIQPKISTSNASALQPTVHEQYSHYSASAPYPSEPSRAFTPQWEAHIPTGPQPAVPTTNLVPERSTHSRGAHVHPGYAYNDSSRVEVAGRSQDASGSAPTRRGDRGAPVDHYTQVKWKLEDIEDLIHRKRKQEAAAHSGRRDTDGDDLLEQIENALEDLKQMNKKKRRMEDA